MARNVTSRFGVTDGLDFSSEQGITSISIDKLVPYHDHRLHHRLMTALLPMNTDSIMKLR